jgi:hypothetical protein
MTTNTHTIFAHAQGMAAAVDNYRAYLADLLACVPTHGGPTAMTKLSASGLVSTRLFDDVTLRHILQAATDEFGATVATLVRYSVHLKTWHVMAFYEEEGRVITRSTPLYLSHNTMSTKTSNIHLKPDSPLLFRVTTWIARQVFNLDNCQAFPLLHRASMESLCFRPGTAACLPTSAPSPTEILQLYDAYIHDYATHTREFDHMEASIVDILHAFGALYIGSVQESTSREETVYIQQALDAVKPHGVTHLWWVEDYTLFEENCYKLVIRYNMAQKPYYAKRKLSLRKNRERLQDVETRTVSNSMSWDYGECGILDFNKWVESFLGIPSAKALPYLRSEVLSQNRVLPWQYPCARPFLVNGKVADIPVLQQMAPRLMYSPDLYVERAKIPPGTNPCTIHFRLAVKPMTSIDTDGLDMRLFLRIGDDKKNAYRVLFTKDGQIYPERDQIRVFIESVNEKILGKDAIQLVVLRKNLAPCGMTIVEFLVTSHFKPFRLYTDNKTCDYDIRMTLHEYHTDRPRVFDPLDIPVYTNSKLLNGALMRDDDKSKSLIPLVYVENDASTGKYQCLYYDGLALVSIS